LEPGLGPRPGLEPGLEPGPGPESRLIEPPEPRPGLEPGLEPLGPGPGPGLGPGLEPLLTEPFGQEKQPPLGDEPYSDISPEDGQYEGMPPEDGQYEGMPPEDGQYEGMPPEDGQYEDYQSEGILPEDDQSEGSISEYSSSEGDQSEYDSPLRGDEYSQDKGSIYDNEEGVLTLSKMIKKIMEEIVSDGTLKELYKKAGINVEDELRRGEIQNNIPSNYSNKLSESERCRQFKDEAKKGVIKVKHDAVELMDKCEPLLPTFFDD
jgi:hypothetical protein